MLVIMLLKLMPRMLMLMHGRCDRRVIVPVAMFGRGFCFVGVNMDKLVDVLMDMFMRVAVQVVAVAMLMVVQVFVLMGVGVLVL